ncbi:proteasome assembly chaperone 1 [Rhinichthys klamathensis goyatoka]|uniref:proteasome assembly chaperone 1 n=1 Tax=Rhinichthys klamathensis goyatoka TaxID=3034132 RepID=UPI0024B62DD4|nr:proteasome assembly chaperone 1 [Rhinichthys klamathensis goyatoka]
MATFFGEVLSVYSRAVEEDEYDDMTRENEEDEQIRREIEEKRRVDVHWLSHTDSGSLSCTDLIIAVGPNATGFVSAYVLSSGGWRPVARVSLWNERSRTDGEPSCVLYQQKQVLICQCSCYVAEDQLFQWTEKVFGCVQARGLSVTLLSDCTVAEYKSSDYLSGSSTPFLRCLKTSTHTSAVACPPLEPPNISCGLAAAVLTHCEVQRIPAVLYQLYSDVPQPDSLSMEAYRETVSAVLKLGQSPGAEVLQKITGVCAVQSNLYT